MGSEPVVESSLSTNESDSVSLTSLKGLMRQVSGKQIIGTEPLRDPAVSYRFLPGIYHRIRHVLIKTREIRDLSDALLQYRKLLLTVEYLVCVDRRNRMSEANHHKLQACLVKAIRISNDFYPGSTLQEHLDRIETCQKALDPIVKTWR